MNYSFDYDNTLIRYKYVYDDEGVVIDAVYDRPHEENIAQLRELAKNKDNKVYIVTARIEGLSFEDHIDNSPSPVDLIKVMNLPVERVFYTRNQCKLPILVDNDIRVHWDDCPKQCESIAASGKLEAILVSAPQGINAFLKEKFIRLLEVDEHE